MQLHGLCDNDEQCDHAYICACVIQRNPDDEGPDEIVQHGTCELRGFKCVKGDGGIFDVKSLDDTAPQPDVLDSGHDSPSADSASDVAPETTVDSTTADAIADTTTDATDATDAD